MDWINSKLSDDALLKQLHLVPVTEQTLANNCKSGVLLWCVRRCQQRAHNARPRQATHALRRLSLFCHRFAF